MARRLPLTLQGPGESEDRPSLCSARGPFLLNLTRMPDGAFNNDAIWGRLWSGLVDSRPCPQPRAPGLTAAGLLFDEDFGEPEAAAGKILGIVVTDQGDAFLADFGEIDFPSHFGEQLGIDARPWRCGLRRGRRLHRRLGRGRTRRVLGLLEGFAQLLARAGGVFGNKWSGGLRGTLSLALALAAAALAFGTLTLV